MYLIGWLIVLFAALQMCAGIAGMFRGIGIVGLAWAAMWTLALFLGFGLIEAASGENWITPLFGTGSAFRTFADWIWTPKGFGIVMGGFFVIGILTAAAKDMR